VLRSLVVKVVKLCFSNSSKTRLFKLDLINYRSKFSMDDEIKIQLKYFHM